MEILSRVSKYQWFLILSFLFVWLWAATDPVYRHDWLLENYLVFIFIPAVLIYGRFHTLSSASYGLITIFMMLHVVGSHYTYAEVPFGYTLQALFDADRNLYDRLVHFLYGFLLFLPLKEIVERWSDLRGFWSYYTVFTTIVASASLYELIEWVTALVVDPAAGIAFLGAQGDIWDAQKDITLALAGAGYTMLILRYYPKIQDALQKENS